MWFFKIQKEKNYIFLGSYTLRSVQLLYYKEKSLNSSFIKMYIYPRIYVCVCVWIFY